MGTHRFLYASLSRARRAQGGKKVTTRECRRPGAITYNGAVKGGTRARTKGGVELVGKRERGRRDDGKERDGERRRKRQPRNMGSRVDPAYGQHRSARAPCQGTTDRVLSFVHNGSRRLRETAPAFILPHKFVELLTTNPIVKGNSSDIIRY